MFPFSSLTCLGSQDAADRRPPGPDLQLVATGEARQGLAGVQSKAIDDMPRPVLAAFQKHARLRQSGAGASCNRSDSDVSGLQMLYEEAMWKKKTKLRSETCAKSKTLKETHHLTAPRSLPRKLPRQKQTVGTAPESKVRWPHPKMGRSPPSDKGSGLPETEATRLLSILSSRTANFDPRHVITPVWSSGDRNHVEASVNQERERHVRLQAPTKRAERAGPFLT
jgi:hypothetical protein